MTHTPADIQNAVRHCLETHGIAPRRALRAAETACRSLSLSARAPMGNRIETLLELRDKIVDIHPDNDLAMAIVSWLASNYGGRTLFKKWWGFKSGNGERGIGNSELQNQLLEITSIADPVRSDRGRQLRTVIWMLIVTGLCSPVPGPCRVATALAAMIEVELAGVYLPTGKELARMERDELIYRLLTNPDAIDSIRERLDNLSQSRIYEINKRLSRQKSKNEQPELF